MKRTGKVVAFFLAVVAAPFVLAWIAGLYGTAAAVSAGLIAVGCVLYLLTPSADAHVEELARRDRDNDPRRIGTV